MSSRSVRSCAGVSWSALKVPPAGFKYTEMLCWAAGGPQHYTGRDMEASHRHLAITEAEWEAFMDDLQTTLDKFSVPAAEQAEVKALIQSTYAAIVVPEADRVEPGPMVA
jgi:hemoglobin